MVDSSITFGAFYGFLKFNVDKINTVQDLGFLINNNYK